MWSEEAPKPADTADAGEGEPAATTQSKSKKSKDEQTVMTNIESLYFADSCLFQGLSGKLLREVLIMSRIIFHLIVTVHIP